MSLPKGRLWDRIVATAEQAKRSGALLPIPTDSCVIKDRGIGFLVRVLSGLKRKEEAREKQDADAEAGKTVNPFLPPEAELTVGDVSDTHIGVLNKFNVVEHHLLIVTRRFEDQETLLTPGDMEAFWTCLSEYKGLGFYNGGREAGASQQHKHLQVVPLPLASQGPAIPIEAVLPETGRINEPSEVPAFPFLHSFARTDAALGSSPAEAARNMFELYAKMLQQVGMEPPGPAQGMKQSRPYCFLLTREWALLVPRTREFFEDISFNSLAFAGSLFVKDDRQLERLRTVGPMNALMQVTEKR
jgi:ATP adenylyltransferase